jgi:Flp pilus assembly protein TadG
MSLSPELHLRLRIAGARPRPHARRGIALIQCLLMFTVLVGIASLGADYGRVQLAKIELQRCATAAARAAASRFQSNPSAARDLAVAYGQYNTVDGSPVTIDRNNDVEFGIWNAASKTFVVVNGSNLSSANAVRVTARRQGANGVPMLFAGLIGKPRSDVSASSIARVSTPTASAGFVGLDKMEVGNNLLAASYNSGVGPPGGSNVSSGFVVGSNGSMQFGNNAEIRGDVTRGPGGSVSHGNHWFVTGSQGQQATPFTYPATESAGVSSSGELKRDQDATVTLSAGTYLYSKIDLSNNVSLVTTGPVTIYVSESAQFANNVTFTPYNNDPANLRIRVIGSASLQVGNGLTGAAEIYGPGSKMQIGNNAVFGGQIVGKEVQIGTNASLYRDTGSSGEGGGSSGSVTTVK